MKHTTKIIVLLFFIILIAAFWLVKLPRIDITQELGSDMMEIIPGLPLSQEFTSTHNRLNEIQITNLYDPTPHDSIANKEPFLVILKDAEAQREISRLEFSRYNIGSGKLRFRFPTIKDSKGKDFIVSLTSLVQERPNKNNMKIGFSKIDQFQGGFKMIIGENGTPNGNLSFRTMYKDRLVILIRDSISEFFTRFSQDLSFLIFYLLICITFVFAIIVSITQKKSYDKILQKA